MKTEDKTGNSRKVIFIKETFEYLAKKLFLASGCCAL